MNWILIFEIAIGLFIGEFLYDFLGAIIERFRRAKKKSNKAIFKEQRKEIIGFVDRTKDERA